LIQFSAFSVCISSQPTLPRGPRSLWRRDGPRGKIQSLFPREGQSMKYYKVGGCVRDALLGLVPKDIDWMVQGGTPEAMLAQGFKRVGADFPVFLCPKTGDEYALARKERKTSAGHKGFFTVFDPSVTVEEDLSRRDLTINAIAMDPLTGALIDPFGGVSDLKAKILRHVSEAFSEDPLRALRLARFKARLGFDIAPETMALCQEICSGGALRELSVERVCAELRQIFATQLPQLGMAALIDMGALASLDPAWPARLGPAQMAALAQAREQGAPEWAMARLACCQGLDPEASLRFMERLRFPADVVKRGTRAAMCVQWALGLNPQSLDALGAAQALERCGAPKLSPAELHEFSHAVDAELQALGAQASVRALAASAIARAPAIALADLSAALARPKADVPQAVRDAKAAAFAAEWPPAPKQRKPKA
jgi:tRNA nucleotidyltransferase/poly(A) polymerase